MIDRVYPMIGWQAVVWVGLFVACGPCWAAEAGQVDRIRDSQRLMGVPWTITVYAEPAVGRRALAAAFAEVARLERILSDYDPESELSQLSSAAPMAAAVPVGDDLWRVLVRAGEIRDMSGGAFDPTVGPLTSLWRQARRAQVLPLPAKLAAARAAVGADGLRLDADRRTVRLAKPAMRLDLGGIGIGYAADRALEVIRDHGLTAAMIDASGDIVVSGRPPGRPGWRIGIAAVDGGAPAAEGEWLILENAAVTTSGDAFQAVEIDGTRYSHIVDPRTGLGVPGPAAVTVIAADCTTADAVATAASVLGPAAGPPFVESMPGVAARFIWGQGIVARELRTSRWPAQSDTSAGRDGGGWGKD
jgi:thiamine biosynthesis lipoprotein